MQRHSSNATTRHLVDVLNRQETTHGDTFSVETIVYEICGAAGISLFAAGIYRIIEISKPLGWSLALVAVFILAEIIVHRLRLAFCGSLISLLFTVAVFGLTLDATISLPIAALTTVAASLIYLTSFNTPFVLTLTSFALTALYITANGTMLNLGAIALIGACLLMVVGMVHSYRCIPELQVDLEMRPFPASSIGLRP